MENEEENSRKRSREPEEDEEGADEYDEDFAGEPVEKRPALDDGAKIRGVTSIPELSVGLVIGRSGQQLARISSECNCKIQICNEREASGFRKVEIYGLPEDVEKGKILINDVVTSKWKTLRPLKDEMSGKIVEVIEIPAEKCGYIIGKRGDVMAQLRAASGCRIALLQESHLPTSPKPLHIVGFPEQVEKAKQAVAKILASRPEERTVSYAANSYSTTHTVQVEVPRDVVGAIMGKQGSNIRRLSDESGAKIQFLNDDDLAHNRKLVVIGAEEKVRKAVEEIKRIVEQQRKDLPRDGLMIYYLDVPDSKCGLVIGQHGDTIRRINAESGAHCELSRVVSESPHEKTFVIRGTEAAVEHAKHLIRIQVGDIPPGTPFSAPLWTSDRPSTSAAPAPPPAQDYSDQWLQYFLQIGDKASADAVREKIARMKGPSI